MNPYRVVDPTDVLWKRSGAWAVDALAGTLISLFTFLVVRALGGTALAVVLTLAATIAYWFFANVILQGTRGYTPGKLLCGLRVVDADGRPCGPQRALRRSLLWLVDGFPYVLPATAFGAAMSDRHGQRVGDRFAGTYVIDEQFLGSPPVAVALPTDPSSGLRPYQLEMAGDYLPPELDIMTLKRLRDARPAAPSIPVRGTLSGSPSDDPLLAAAAQLDRQPLVPPAGTQWEPRWDAEREAYVRWNAVTREWVLFDEDQRQWVLV